jgi:predicted lipoprotein with Yx(FWY)xxD motif
MQRTTTFRGGLLLAAALLIGIVAAIYAMNSRGDSGRSQHVVMTAKNAALHKTILVNLRGRSLYSLSVERHGKFICTNMACLSLWKPLTVAKGTSPSGVSGLSVVTRPGAQRQVAYRGAPLYSFTGDHNRGDVKGNGFKDVGVWRVAVLGKSSSSSPAPTTTSRYGY